MVVLIHTRPSISCPFHHRGLECKSKKSRDTWSNSKFGFGVQNEVGQWLFGKEHKACQENTLFIPNTLFQQHKRRLYTCISAEYQYWNQIDYILCSQRWRQSILSAKIRPGGNFGSDHELFIAKFRNKLKKVGKTRPFVYDLNKSPTIIQWKWQIDSRDEIWQIECLKNHWREFITLYRRWRFQRLQKGTKFCYAYVLKGQQSLPQGCTILCCLFLTWLCILSFP